MAAQSTYTPIATLTGTGSNYLFAFNSIPQTYTDLVVVITGTIASGSSAYLGTQVNGDQSNTFYSATYMLGNGSAASSGRSTSATYLTVAPTSFPLSTTLPTTGRFTYFNYTNTTTFKSILMEQAFDQNGSGIVATAIGLYRSTGALTSIQITTLNGGLYWSTSSVATLYGITAA
jgi:hypothetical protein